MRSRFTSNNTLSLLAALGLVLVFQFFPAECQAQSALALSVAKSSNGSQSYSLNIQTLLLLTSLSFLPAVVLMMTSFTRIIIVLSFLRTALRTQGTPPNQVLVGLALF
jgi:flagellar biosynthetic protein FliP